MLLRRHLEFTPRQSEVIVNIFSKTSIYFKLCKADLKHDMVKRVMYSLIQATAPVYIGGTSPDGVWDYKAQDYAIEGVGDIVKYGTAICVDEMRNLPTMTRNDSDLSVYINAKKLLDSKDYENCLDILIEGFKSPKWGKGGYGGKPWVTITETIKKLNYLNNEFKRNSEDMKKKQSEQDRDKMLDADTELKKQILIYLNVFDGLSHNSGSVLEKLIEKEHLDKYPKLPYGQTLKDITRIMDSKNLKDPKNTFKIVKDHIETPIQYKEWMNRLDKKHSDSEKDELDLEMVLIRLSRDSSLISKIEELNIHEGQRTDLLFLKDLKKFNEMKQGKKYDIYQGEASDLIAKYNDILEFNQVELRHIYKTINNSISNKNNGLLLSALKIIKDCDHIQDLFFNLKQEVRNGIIVNSDKIVAKLASIVELFVGKIDSFKKILKNTLSI